MGDPTDGIPGVKGVGIKTASKLIREHSTVDAVLEKAAEGEIKGKLGEKLTSPESIKNARIALDLVKLIDDVVVDAPLEELRRRPINRHTLSTWLYTQEFWSVLKPKKTLTPFF